MRPIHYDKQTTEPSEGENQKKEARPERPLLRLALTAGDPNGVGLEVILKALAEPDILGLCTPIIYGSARVAAIHRRVLAEAGVETPEFRVVGEAAEARPGQVNLIDCQQAAAPGGELKVEFGKVDPEAGHLAQLALEAAVADLQSGAADALVTAPICKAAIQGADFRFPGHTEFLAARLGSEGRDEPLMILANSLMRVALCTTHLPIAQVAAAITAELVQRKVKLLCHSLRHDFLISSPRIAVLGLNPHCGDQGALGQEEDTLIAPALAKVRAEEGILCFGPYPADGFFGSGQWREFDGVLAMYHDQGLAPFKALSMNDGVNITAGLPYVRTSPDHGTAFDIAGKGVADEGSMRQAIYTAIDLCRGRQSDEQACRNPLPKLYHERREDSERSRHTQPPQAGAAR